MVGQLCESNAFVIAIVVNIHYSVNMAISEIRKCLEDLDIRTAGPIGRDGYIPEVPIGREPESILLTELEWSDKRKG
jgi:hypothetical protein